MLRSKMLALAWSLWCILLLGVLYMAVRMATERMSSPEAGPGLGLFLILLLLGVLAGLAGLLVWAGRRQTHGGLIFLMILLAYPLVALIARPIVMGYKQYQWDKEEARNGDFSDPALAAMVAAIRKDDVATLTRLLDGKAPPALKDKAGNDLLAYTVGLVRQRDSGVAIVRALLDAGADVRNARSGDGVDVLNIAMPMTSDQARALVVLLLERGADPNLVDPRTSQSPILNVSDVDELRLLLDHGASIDGPDDIISPVVHYVRTQKWDLALYAIEHGAKLDLADPNRTTVDHYLKEWETSVYGAHPEGWERVKQAIAAKSRQRH